MKQSPRRFDGIPTPSYLQENTLGQKFRVDAVLYCGKLGLKAAGSSDNLEATVNYANTYRLLSCSNIACNLCRQFYDLLLLPFEGLGQECAVELAGASNR